MVMIQTRHDITGQSGFIAGVDELVSGIAGSAPEVRRTLSESLAAEVLGALGDYEGNTSEVVHELRAAVAYRMIRMCDGLREYLPADTVHELQVALDRRLIASRNEWQRWAICYLYWQGSLSVQEIVESIPLSAFEFSSAVPGLNMQLLQPAYSALVGLVNPRSRNTPSQVRRNVELISAYSTELVRQSPIAIPPSRSSQSGFNSLCISPFWEENDDVASGSVDPLDKSAILDAYLLLSFLYEWEAEAGTKAKKGEDVVSSTGRLAGIAEVMKSRYLEDSQPPSEVVAQLPEGEKRSILIEWMSGKKRFTVFLSSLEGGT